MKKKILIVGNSASAYALAKKLSEKHDIYITPASDTLKEFATCLDIREDNIAEILAFVVNNDIDMTIPISQIAINADISGVFSENKQSIFAPTAKANEIVSDKAYAKKVLYKLHINTPKFGIFEKENIALDYIKNQQIPFVIKNKDSNSAAIMTSEQMAKKIINSCFIEKNKKIIIEDYVYGTPFSFYAITDGYKALPIGSSITYKHSLEGDGGQLTSGMGACAPNYKISIDNEYFIMDNIIYPALEYLGKGGSPYLGIIGVNGIMYDNKITILGWHSFMQDCDACAVINNIDEDIYYLFESCVIGSFSDEIETIHQKDQYSVSLVINCKNKQNKENSINGINCLDENTIICFYPIVRKNRYLELEADYGPNLILTSHAPTVSKASEKVYEEAQDIDFAGIQYRKDIANTASIA